MKKQGEGKNCGPRQKRSGAADCGESRVGGTRAVLFVVLPFLILIASAGCGGKNVAGQPPAPAYTFAQVVRDGLTSSGGFILEAQKNHQADCDSACKLSTIRDAQRCVNICNAINAAIDARGTIKSAMDEYCAGPGWLEGTAPCAENPDKEAAVRAAYAAFQAAFKRLQAALMEVKR